MNSFELVSLVVGIGLLTLSGSSGYALFKTAFKPQERSHQGVNLMTLWGLFVIGLAFGLLLVWWGLPSKPFTTL
mgnify:CR=1 FL=1